MVCLFLPLVPVLYVQAASSESPGRLWLVGFKQRRNIPRGELRPPLIINELFVPVKVDRDERPDVDSRYQSAIAAISGQGGWPLTGFLTPDGKPFYGGTYFPPKIRWAARASNASCFQFRKHSRRGVPKSIGPRRLLRKPSRKRKSFMGRVVTSIRHCQRDRWRGASAIRRNSWRLWPRAQVSHSSAIDLLLERYQATRDESFLRVAERTLEGMALGGVYDQVGGGFHRYSVDERCACRTSKK